MQTEYNRENCAELATGLATGLAKGQAFLEEAQQTTAPILEDARFHAQAQTQQCALQHRLPD